MANITPQAPTLSEFLEKAKPLNHGVSDEALTRYWEQTYASQAPPRPDSASSQASSSLPTLDAFLAKATPLNPNIPAADLTRYWQREYGSQGAQEHEPPDKPWTSDVKEVGRQVAAGFAVDVPRMAGQAGKAITRLLYAGSPQTQATMEVPFQVVEADAKLREVGWAPDMEGRGEIAKAFIRGGRAVGPSLATLAGYLMPGGNFLGPVGTVALFGGSQYQDEYDKMKEAGASEEDARNAGLITAAIQGGGEVAANYLQLRMLGVGGKALRKVIEGSTETGVLKPWLKATAGAVVGEASTEIGQDVGTAAVERAYGLETEPLPKIAYESGGAAGAMTLLLAPFGIHGHFQNARRAEAISQILDNPQADTKEARAATVEMLADEAAQLGLSDAKVWREQALQDVQADRPIRRDIIHPQPTRPADPIRQILTAPSVDQAIDQSAAALDTTTGVTPESLDRAIAAQNRPKSPVASQAAPAIEQLPTAIPGQELAATAPLSERKSAISVPEAPVAQETPTVQLSPKPPTGKKPIHSRTVDEIHALADAKGIPWDEDEDFMDFTESITGKRALDDLVGPERNRLYAALERRQPLTQPETSESTVQPAAPRLRFEGIQQGAKGVGEFELWTLQSDYPGLAKDSTYSRQTLEQAGITVPPAPTTPSQPSPSPTQATAATPLESRPTEALASGAVLHPAVQAYIESQPKAMRFYFTQKAQGFQPDALMEFGGKPVPVKVQEWLDRNTALIETPSREVHAISDLPGKLMPLSGKSAVPAYREAEPAVKGPAVVRPRQTLPQEQSENLLERAEVASDLMAQGEPGGKIFTPNEMGPGMTVTSYGSTYPKFYGPLKMRKSTVLKALEKIKRDKGEDIGPTVEKVKAAILADRDLDAIVGEFPEVGTMLREQMALYGYGEEPEPTTARPTPKPEQPALPMSVPVETGQRPIIGREATRAEAPLFSKEAQTEEPEQSGLPMSPATSSAILPTMAPTRGPGETPPAKSPQPGGSPKITLDLTDYSPRSASRYVTATASYPDGSEYSFTVRISDHSLDYQNRSAVKPDIFVGVGDPSKFQDYDRPDYYAKTFADARFRLNEIVKRAAAEDYAFEHRSPDEIAREKAIEAERQAAIQRRTERSDFIKRGLRDFVERHAKAAGVNPQTLRNYLQPGAYYTTNHNKRTFELADQLRAEYEALPEQLGREFDTRPNLSGPQAGGPESAPATPSRPTEKPPVPAEVLAEYPDLAQGEPFMAKMEIEGEGGERRAAAGMDPRIMKVLGGNLYSGNLGRVAVKEMLQNAVDSVRGLPSGSDGRVYVEVNTNARTIRVHDTGVGMLPAVAMKELVDIGGSKKAEGSSGGFGIAKVAIFANAERIYVQTVAEDAGGDLVQTTLHGTGDDWMDQGKGLTIKTTKDHGQGTTGTLVEITLRPEAKITDYEIKEWLGNFLQVKQLPMTIEAVLDGMPVKPGTWDTRDAGAITKADTVSFPGGTIDIYLSANPYDTSYPEVDILNFGLPQFRRSFSLPSKVSLPSVIVADFKANAGPEEADYPFSPDRERLRDDALRALSGYVAALAKGRLEEERNIFARMIDEAPYIPDTQLKVIDTGGVLPATLVEKITQSAYIKHLGEALDKAFVLLQRALEPVAEVYGQAKFSGIGLGSKYLGINVSGSSLGDSEAKNLILLSPYTTLEEVNRRVALEQITPDKVNKALAEQLTATIIHELTHQQERGHGVEFAGALTRNQGHVIQEAGEAFRVILEVLDAVVLDAEPKPSGIFAALKGGARESIVDKLKADLDRLRVAWGSGDDLFGKISSSHARQRGNRAGAGDPLGSTEGWARPTEDLRGDRRNSAGTVDGSPALRDRRAAAVTSPLDTIASALRQAAATIEQAGQPTDSTPSRPGETDEGAASVAQPQASYENGPRLSALHNLSAENLLFADKMGGLAVPSIAVVPETIGMTDMGEITLIGRRPLAEPTQVPVHDADVYSATFPAPEYAKVSTKTAQRMVDAIAPFASQFNNYNAKEVTWESAVNRPDPREIIRAWLNGEAAKAMYLAQQGIAVKPVVRNKVVPFPWVKYLDWDRYREILPFNDERSVEERERASILVKTEIRKAIDRYLVADHEGRQLLKLSRGVGETEAIAHARERAAVAWGFQGDWINTDEPMPQALDWKIHDSHTGLGQKEVDRSKTEARLNAALAGKEAAFTQWVNERVLSMFGEPFLRLHGRRVPYTLENIVEVMSGRVRSRQETLIYGEGRARAEAAKQFDDLEQMRRAAGKIADKYTVSASRDKAKQLMQQYRELVLPYYGEQSSTEPNLISTWDGLDASMKAMAQWAKGGKTAENLRRALLREGFRAQDMRQDILDAGVEAGKAWLAAPVPYFEAKPQRAVSLDEFAGAVIPSTASADVRAVLERHGIPYQEYDVHAGRTAQQEATVAFRRELDAQAQAGVLFQPQADYQVQPVEPAPIFYSQAERVLEQKMPNKALVAQIRNILSPANGVKPDELTWSGLDEFLKTKPIFTKQEVLDYLKANQVEIRDVEKGQVDQQLLADLNEAVENIHRAIDESHSIKAEIFREIGNALERDGQARAVFLAYNKTSLQVIEDLGSPATDVREGAEAQLKLILTGQVATPLIDKLRNAIRREEQADAEYESLMVRKRHDSTKFSSWVIPGGQNYRELLLTLPPGELTVADREEIDRLTDARNRLSTEYAELERAQVELRVFDPRGAETMTNAARLVAIGKEIERNNDKIRAIRDRQRGFTGGHFSDVPNVLAHVRMNDRTTEDGKKVLFLEEVQSDLHQRGRKEGYGKNVRWVPVLGLNDVRGPFNWEETVTAQGHKHWTASDKDDHFMGSITFIEERGYVANRGTLQNAAFATLDEAKYAVEQGMTKATSFGVPDAPFKKTWHELALRRMLRYAAEHGYDTLAWTTGEQQADRYDLSKRVSSISWTGKRDGTEKIVTIVPKTGNDIEFRVLPDGEVVSINEGGALGNGFDGKTLDAVVGEDVADTIMSSTHGDISGDGLKVGGKGMKGFYDEIIPDYLNKYTKRWGARVNELNLDIGAEERKKYAEGPQHRIEQVHALDITPQMRDSVMTDGQILFQRQAAYPVRPGESADDARQLALFAIGDLDRAAEGVSTAGGTLVSKGASRAAGGIRTLGLGFTPELIKTGRIDLRGQTVTSAEDVARLAQIYRDPRFETFRIFYVKGDRIVAHEGLSSRLPGSASTIAGPDVARSFHEYRDRMERLGADGYYLVHNHPSGNPSPSLDDMFATAAFRRKLSGFKGHIVINSGKYAVINAANEARTFHLESSEDPLLSPSIPHDLLGEPVPDSKALARLAKRLETPEGFVTLLFLSPGTKTTIEQVKAIQEVPEALFRRTPQMVKYLSGRGRVFGSDLVVAYSPVEDRETIQAAETLIQRGYLADLAHGTGQPTPAGIAPALSITGQKAREQRHRDTEAIRVAQSVYHGTPHIWEPEPGFPHGRPRLDKIGTGQGAHSYGWGWYSADAEAVSDYYRPLADKQRRRVFIDGVSSYDFYNSKALFEPPKKGDIYYGLDEALGFIAHYVRRYSDEQRGLEEARAVAEKLGDKDIATAAAKFLFENHTVTVTPDFTPPRPGATYKLDLPDEVIPKLLVWDKPFSQQPGYVKLKLKRAGFTVFPGRDPRGAVIYDVMRGKGQSAGTADQSFDEKSASDYLLSIGIPGLRYLDQQSRSKGEGSYNYVIWDQKVLDKIALLERNGEKLDAIRELDQYVVAQQQPSFRVAQPVYHGTPHIWEPEPGFPHGRPRLDKIGTGEGAHSYGWGWYSADMEEVSDYYRPLAFKQLRRVFIDGVSASDFYNSKTRSGPPKEGAIYYGLDEALGFITHYVQRYSDEQRGLEEARAVAEKLGDKEKATAAAKYLFENHTVTVTPDFMPPRPGATYKLDIPDEVLPKLLDWDKPLSEQSAYVEALLRREGLYGNRPHLSARQLYEIGLRYFASRQFEADARVDISIREKLRIAHASLKKGAEEYAKTVIGFTDGYVKSKLFGHYSETADSMYRRLALAMGEKGGSYGRSALAMGGKLASEYLASIGIPGTKYLDAASREALEETRQRKPTFNYVIWDQKVLDKIALLERNGEKLDAIRELDQYVVAQQQPSYGTAAPVRGIERMGALTDAQQTALQHVHGEPETWRTKLAAFQSDWKRTLIQGLFDQYAPILNYSKTGYILARMTKGGEGTLEALLLYGKPYVDADGAYRVDYEHGQMNGFGKVLASLQGEADRFLEWVAAQRAERLKGIGLEHLYRDEDIAALKTLNDGTMPDGSSRKAAYNTALVQLNEWNAAMVKIAVDSKLIDPDVAKLYKDTPYVPFYRLQEEGVVSGFGMKAGLVNQYAWKKLKGGTQHLNDDLLANLLQNWSHLITASAKNRAAKATLEAAVQAGVAHEVPSGAPGKGLVGFRDDVTRTIPLGQEYEEGGVTKVSDGTAKVTYNAERMFRVDDPALFDAVAALHYAGLGSVAKPFIAAKRYLTTAVTVNPAFKIRNLIRDSIQAIGTAELSYNPLKNIAQGFEATALESETRAQVLAGGGMIRFGTMLDGNNADRTRRLIEQQGVNPDDILDDAGKITRFWRHRILPAFVAYQEFGDRGEQVNRVALYEQLRAKGTSHLEASFWARDLLDFSLSGKWEAVRILTQVVPFMNARLQGIYKLGRATRADYRRMGTTLGAVALSSIALLLAYQDDEDWKKREDWDRDNYWWFKVGDLAFRLPKPFEIGALGTLAERGAEYLLSDEMTASRLGERLSATVFSQLSMNPTPQLVKPLMDLYANKDAFTGRPIETLGMERLRKEDRATERTSQIARFFGSLGLPDPTQLAMGQWNTLSPVQIDALIHGYFGWVGTSATTVLDYGLRPMMNRGERPNMRLREVFLAGNFVETLPTGGSRYVTDLYDQAQEIEQAYGSWRDALKRGDLSKAKEIYEEEREKIRQYSRVEAVKRHEGVLNAQIRRIEASREMGGAEKRRRIDDLEARKHQMAQRFAMR